RSEPGLEKAAVLAEMIRHEEVPQEQSQSEGIWKETPGAIRRLLALVACFDGGEDREEHEIEDEDERAGDIGADMVREQLVIDGEEILAQRGIGASEHTPEHVVGRPRAKEPAAVEVVEHDATCRQRNDANQTQCQETPTGYEQRDRQCAADR